MNFPRRALLFLGVLVGFLLVTLPVAEAKDDGTAIATDASLPGKNNADGRGSDFAPELYKRLIQAGGEAHLVTFKWRREFEKPEEARTGALIVFRDERGRYLGIDLYRAEPVWLPSSKEPQKWLNRMYPALVTEFVSDQTEAKLEGKTADLARTKSAPATQPAR